MGLIIYIVLVEMGNTDNSIITSFETVDNIINGVDDKSNIWNVNTEKEYHETKK